MDEQNDERILRVLRQLAGGGPTARLVLERALDREFASSSADELGRLRQRLGLPEARIEQATTAPAA